MWLLRGPPSCGQVSGALGEVHLWLWKMLYNVHVGQPHSLATHPHHCRHPVRHLSSSAESSWGASNRTIESRAHGQSTWSLWGAPAPQGTCKAGDPSFPWKTDSQGTWAGDTQCVSHTAGREAAAALGSLSRAAHTGGARTQDLPGHVGCQERRPSRGLRRGVQLLGQGGVSTGSHCFSLYTLVTFWGTWWLG